MSISAGLSAPAGRHGWGLLGSVLFMGLGLGGCSVAEVQDDEVEDLTIVVEADKSRILEEEQALASRRSQMETERERLARERLEIAKKLSSLSKKDRKAREKLEAEQQRLDDEEKRVRDRAQKFEQERTKLDRQKNQLLERIATMTKRGKGGMTIEEREAALARREKDVAKRERDLAKREEALAKREAQANTTLQELSNVLANLGKGGGAKTVYISGSASGGTVTKIQAQKAQRQVRSRMDSKGILMDDLPPTAKSLFQQANQALSAKDHSEAYAAYGQVLGIIDGISIDQSFVQAKMGRLNRAVANKQLDEQANKRVQGLLAEVSNAFADGRFDRANKKANQIATVLKRN